MINMNILKDKSGQGNVEYLLLLGGLIIVAIGALVIYSSYFSGQPFNLAHDIQNSREHSSSNERSL